MYVLMDKYSRFVPMKVQRLVDKYIRFVPMHNPWHLFTSVNAFAILHLKCRIATKFPIMRRGY